MERVKLFPIRMYLAVTALREREEGQAMVEYALILSLVAIAAIAALKTLSGGVNGIFNSINDDI